MTRLIKSVLLTGTVAMSMLAMGTGAARADIVPTLTSITSNGDGTFTWDYDAELNAAQNVVNGDFFTIYDFAGFVPGSALAPSSAWSFSSASMGVTPTPLLPLINLPGGIPDTALPNLTWTYLPANPNTIISGAADLGTFSAISKYSAIATSAFSGQGTEKAGPTAGSKVDNFGWEATPAVPEPCTMALLGLGAAPLLGGLRRRSRKS
jgi:hypothetical protein